MKPADYKITIHKDTDAKVWVSKCPELNLVSQGTNKERAKEAIYSAIILYIKHCKIRGIKVKGQ